MSKLIFDFGFNNGQNFDYFFLKADYVVGVEANKILSDLARIKFKKYIDQGKLYIENYALVENDKLNVTDFYIAENSGHSSLKPNFEVSKKFNKVLVECITPSKLINFYKKKLSIDEIEYIKIDLENHDHEILKNLNNHNINSKFLSVECHHPNTINELLISDYKSFKFVKGSRQNRSCNIKDKFGNTHLINFSNDSSGPYGDDIAGNYFSKESIVPYFLNNGLGWIDVHCSINIENYRINLKYDKNTHLKLSISKKIKNLLKDILRLIKKKLGISSLLNQIIPQ